MLLFPFLGKAEHSAGCMHLEHMQKQILSVQSLILRCMKFCFYLVFWPSHMWNKQKIQCGNHYELYILNTFPRWNYLKKMILQN